jgi:hypothetical protein
VGANPTQARAIALFLIGSICLAAGIARDTSWLLIALGVLIAAGSVALFLKCKPWETEGEL